MVAGKMSPKVSRENPQRGIALIVVLVLLGLLVGVLVVGITGDLARQNKKGQQTADSLAKAKEALIGYAASPPPNPTNTERPGELPCPDMNNDGYGDGSCVAGAIGRVPWKTLGIPEPRDGNGETLWYAIAGPFRNKNMSPAPINSDTLGNLSVYLGSSATVLTTQAVAVVLAPGPAINAQDRGASSAACSTTGTSIARNRCAANYLESTGGGNNAQTGGPFIQAAASGTFNDRLLVITNADLMPLVEQRVAREIMALLNSYYNANGVYPWANLSDGNSNTPPDGYNRGRFPCSTASPTDWGDSGTPSLPNWLTNGCGNNGWASVIFYGVAKSKLQGGGSGCSSSYSMCSASNPFWSNSGLAYLCPYASSPFACSLTNVGSGNADVILITPGASNGSPRSWPSSFYGTITGYFEDSDNSDNDDDQYTIPTASNDPNRDRMFIMR